MLASGGGEMVVVASMYGPASRDGGRARRGHAAKCSAVADLDVALDGAAGRGVDRRGLDALEVGLDQGVVDEHAAGLAWMPMYAAARQVLPLGSRT